MAKSHGVGTTLHAAPSHTSTWHPRNQRGEDADQPHNKASVHYNSDVAGCLHEQTSRSDVPEYMAGTFVWTLHDYMGEPGAWPHVSSSFGAIDLAGTQTNPTLLIQASL